MTDDTQSTREDGKEDAGEEQAEYYVLKALLEAADNVAGKLDEFNRTYVQGSLAAGREFLAEARVDQKKAFKNLADEGRDYISEKKTAGRDAVDRLVDGGRQFLSDAVKSPKETIEGLADDVGKIAGDVRKNARETFSELTEKGRTISSGVRKDSSVLMEDLLRKGKKILADAPGGEVVEEKMENALHALSNRMNLPTKEDIRNLSDALKDLSDKIDAMEAEAKTEGKKNNGNETNS